MKILKQSNGDIPRCIPKSMRVMRIGLFLLFVMIAQLHAENLYSQNTVINLKLENATVEQVLDKIEKETDFSFLFTDKSVDIDWKVNVDVHDKNINELLDILFGGTNVQYRIVDKQIVLSNRPLLAENVNQQKKISGKVIDANGDPVIGANVVEKETTNGTITDMSGNFVLSVNPNAVLSVSYIGYVSKDIQVKDRSSFTISLEEDSELLDEVVVVGYGTMKKKDLTGAVGTLKGESLSARKTTQLSTALQGATSGVLVTRDNSAPGATASIKIRGVTTIGESSPLVIVDGVPGDINQVNPDDVESMSVLKDAASASIYGSRAAAGVIVITTKRAKENDLSLNYNFEYGWEMPTRLPEYVGAQRFMEMVNELRYNDNNAGGWYQTYSEDQVNNWIKNNATDPDAYPITDWQDEILKNSAPRQTHSINIAGGSKVVQTKASFRYDKTDGIYVNRNYERYMIRVNNDFKINKYIEAHLDVNFKRSKSEEPHRNPMDLQYRATPPIYAARWSNGMWGDVKDGENTLAMITDGGLKTSWYNRLGGKAAIDISPIEGLKISGVIAPTYNFDKVKSFRKQVPFTYANDPNTVKGYMNGFTTTKLTENRNDSYDVTTQFFANYNKSFGQHDLSAMIGYEDYYAFWENLSASRDQYELMNFPYLDIGPENLRDNGGNAEEYAYRSFFGRIAYSYASRYLLQVNFRRDGSSRFAPDSRWANFPSLSAGWVVSEEQFMKNLNWNWLSFLKLRGSWGTLGNERITMTKNSSTVQNYYPYQSALNFGSALFYSGNSLNSLLSAAQQYYAVRNISWETTETWDIGLDANFLDGRLHFSGDFYKKKTKDMLLALEIPKFIGYDNPSVNTGNMHTTGYDLEIGWRDQVGDFRYSVSANLSDFISKMGNLGGTEFLGEKVKMEGSQFDEWYGYISDGLFQTQEEVDNSPKLNNNVTVGDIKYKDISGPDGVPDGKISSEYDRVLLGGSLPRYMFGVNFSASYKGFDFSMMFQGVGSQNSRISRNMIEGLNTNWGGFPSILEGDYWSTNNTAAENAGVKYPRLTRNSVDANMSMSDYWMFNGRYLRMKNLTVGYTLPGVWTKKISMESVRFYLSGNDLFCLSKYPHGWDPEVSTTGYPITMSVLLGVSVNF
ncbi:TonB-dependent receptor [Parabacteroides faecis]|uniref:TonB-dependent receptor n=1 Tax=Parabacteroides TaxID=375288 RepID=UPI000F00A846|nr:MULTISPECIES: TonB-dependent receptor [Parabacteroides]MBC8617660.1 TonB-dependent receptor [Parabacteroides faecis]RHR99472.1 SusC/RagA family TonB-linked outer membrane protein [Parabacteroides sp. AF14-59]